MVTPVKAAKHMFDQFLAKADPEMPTSLPESGGIPADRSARAAAGGKARAQALTAVARRKIAKKAAKARWK